MLTYLWTNSFENVMISEGDSVPKFEINDANGNKVKSTDFKGKKHAIYSLPMNFFLPQTPNIFETFLSTSAKSGYLIPIFSQNFL